MQTLIAESNPHVPRHRTNCKEATCFGGTVAICIGGICYALIDSNGWAALWKGYAAGLAGLWLGCTVIAVMIVPNYLNENFSYFKQRIVESANKIYNTTSEYFVTHKPQITGFTITALTLIALLVGLTETDVISKTEMHKTDLAIMVGFGVLVCSVAAGAAAKKATRTFFSRGYSPEGDTNIQMPLMTDFPTKRYGTSG